jgi:cystathionine gamma-synthase
MSSARSLIGSGVPVLRSANEDAALEGWVRTSSFSLAESLGVVELLIEHPALITHASTTRSLLEIDPGRVALSECIEPRRLVAVYRGVRR